MREVVAVDLSSYFHRFIEDVSIGPPQTDRMDSAVKAIREFLMDRYDLPAANFFLQGSYPNDTAVEPESDDGEYDVDLVAYCVPADTSADSALTVLERHFRSDGRYANRVITKKPCVRLEYAHDDVGKFHVDVVPVRSSPSSQAPYDAPRRGSGWHETAPQEYTQWCVDQGERYSRTVKAMKRWRDHHQTVRTAIKSIVLQVLVSQHMPQIEDDAARLEGTISSLHGALQARSTPPVVPNPVLPTENLAARWEAASFTNFLTELAEAHEWATQAQRATDLVEAVESWREVLGPAFPAPTASALGIRLGDTSHEQNVGFKGWRMGLDPRYSVTVTATQQRGKSGRGREVYPSGGPPIWAGRKICFKAHARRPGHAEVWWQVTNTGGHARQSNSLRGTFLTARSINKGTSKDPTEHWEDTAYTGTHLVRALLVRDGIVVASSPYFQVNIWKAGWRSIP